MQKQNTLPLDFMTRFLLSFTEEILRNSPSYQTSTLKIETKKLVEKKEEIIVNQVRQLSPTEGFIPSRPLPMIKKRVIKEIVKEKIDSNNKRVIQMQNIQARGSSKEVNPFKTFFEQRSQTQRRPPLYIAEPRLPPTVQNVKPFPLKLDLDLKKLNPLVRDPFVAIIECNGPDENVMVIGSMGRKKTGIILTKEEIDQTIQAFSEATKIPIQEGISKVVYGKLIFSSIVSEIIGSKFTIKKMSVPVSYK